MLVSDRILNSLAGNATLKSAGFKVLLAWQYLIIFSPLFFNLKQVDYLSFLFERQLVLYLALAASFAVVRLVFGMLARRNVRSDSLFSICAAGAFAVASTVFALLVLKTASLELVLLATFLLGASDRLLVILWIGFFEGSKTSGLYRTFAIDTVAGSLIALVVLALIGPYAQLFAIGLPLVATVSLVANKWAECGACGDRGLTEGDVACVAQSNGESVTRYFVTFIPVLAYGFGFCFLQGAFVQVGTPLLMASTPPVILGMALSGLLLLVIPEDSTGRSDVDKMHRISMFLCVVGAVGLAIEDESSLVVFFQIAVIAGFNLFDFGVLTLDVTKQKRFGAKFLSFTSSGHFFVYLSFALGLLSGRFVVESLEDERFALLLVVGVAILLLVVTFAFSFDKGETSEVLPACDGCGAEGPKRFTAENFVSSDDVCRELAVQHSLSLREVEVFMVIAKGRNAEYLKQELHISSNTARNHIANIYRKLGVHSSQEMLDLIETKGKPGQ